MLLPVQMLLFGSKKLIAAYPKNAFILASRPYGYEKNPIAGFVRLEVLPFSNQQVRTFIRHWYLANEIRKSREENVGVRKIAEENADRLIQRVEEKPELASLAVNPLLVTMIATVHHYKAVLPGRRVELYRDIFDVFLQRRRPLSGTSNPLSSHQKMEVLRVLAYEMMKHELRTISAKDASKIIEKDLMSVGSSLMGREYLKDIEDQSGLLLDAGENQFTFAHLTYQEFLTASYIFDNRSELESVLIQNIDSGWWDEATRLYAALTDATNVIKACLDKYPDVHAYSLALDCLRDALKVDPNLRHDVEQTLDVNLESDNLELRSVAAEAKLTSRVVFMTQIANHLMIDRRLVSNVEYQLFLSEMHEKGESFFPDHWAGHRFPEGFGRAPATGIRMQDAMRFCAWLTERDRGSSRYRLPTLDEALSMPIEGDDVVAYWARAADGNVLVPSGQIITEFTVTKGALLAQISNDFNKLREHKSIHDAPPPKTFSQLQTRVLPGSGGELFPKIGAGAGLAIEAQMRHQQEMFANYSLDTKLAEVYSLDLEKLMRVFSNMFLSDLGNAERTYSWLSQKETYIVGKFDKDGYFNFDYETQLQSCHDLFSEVSKEYQGTAMTEAHVLSALAHICLFIKSRAWATASEASTSRFLSARNLLYWSARICCMFLGASARLQINSRSVNVVHAQSLKGQCEELLVSLTLHESGANRIQQKNGGLRLTKMTQQ